MTLARRNCDTTWRKNIWDKERFRENRKVQELSIHHIIYWTMHLFTDHFHQFTVKLLHTKLTCHLNTHEFILSFQDNVFKLGVCYILLNKSPLPSRPCDSEFSNTNQKSTFPWTIQLLFFLLLQTRH